MFGVAELMWNMSKKSMCELGFEIRSMDGGTLEGNWRAVRQFGTGANCPPVRVFIEADCVGLKLLS